MEDLDDLMEVEKEDVRKGPEGGKKGAYELATNDKASTEIGISKFSPPSGISENKKDELKENLKRDLEHEAKFSVVGCVPESDGEITCRFETSGVRDVSMRRGMETVQVPVSFEATVNLKDFDEARAHEMENIKAGKKKTVVR